MKISVTKTTKYSHNGYEVVEYQAGQEYEVDDACAQTAIADKWATPAKKVTAPRAATGGRAAAGGKQEDKKPEE